MANLETPHTFSRNSHPKLSSFLALKINYQSLSLSLLTSLSSARGRRHGKMVIKMKGQSSDVGQPGGAVGEDDERL